MLDLPTGYASRPATSGDIDAIWRLMVTVNTAEAGSPGFGRSEIENWLTGKQIDLATDVVVVELDGKLVAAEVVDSRGPYVRPHTIGGVHPDHLDRGIGTALLMWAQQHTEARLDRAPPNAAVRMETLTAADDAHSRHTMEDFGMVPARYFLDMEVEFDGPPAAPQPPPGVVIRQFRPDQELEALAVVSKEGFRDHYGFVEHPIEQRVERLEHWMSSAGHDPELWWVAVAGDDVVGFNLCDPANEGDETVGYVVSLAVLPSHRGRGLGRALLLHAFTEFYARGKRGAALSVDADSLTGATRLYESVGMQPYSRYALWEKELRPGEDLTVTS